MYSRFQVTQKYLHYFLTASNGKGHGIHSPFVYDFIERVLNDTGDFPAYSRIGSLRRQVEKIRATAFPDCPSLPAPDDPGIRDFPGSVYSLPGLRLTSGEIADH